jgi:hypothetical protein
MEAKIRATAERFGNDEVSAGASLRSLKYFLCLATSQLPTFFFINLQNRSPEAKAVSWATIIVSENLFLTNDPSFLRRFVVIAFFVSER